MSKDLENKIISKIIDIEGGYSNNPNDSGGETKYGVTERVARNHGYTGLMKDLSYDFAYTVYKMDYWDKMRLSEISEISEMIAEEIADTAINTGTSRAGKILQKSLDVFNNRQKLYPDLKIDGIIGIRTIHAFKAYMDYRGDEGEIVLYNMLNCLQGAFYAKLVNRREKDEEFMYGWIKNRVVIRKD